jgi:signal recognition particle GTPase
MGKDLTLDDIRRGSGFTAPRGIVARWLDWEFTGEQRRQLEQGLRQIRGMIDSMTVAERGRPELIDLSRQRRIARGSGLKAYEVRSLLRTFEHVRSKMCERARMSWWQRLKRALGFGRSQS